MTFSLPKIRIVHMYIERERGREGEREGHRDLETPHLMHLGVVLTIFLATLRTFYNKFRMQFVGTTTTSQEGFKFSPPGDLNATETGSNIEGE